MPASRSTGLALIYSMMPLAVLLVASSPARAANAALCGKTMDRPDATLENCALVASNKKSPPAEVADARYFRALALQKKGEPDKAIAELTEALKIAPKMAVALVARASTHMSMRSWDKALADVEAALAIEADDANSLALRGSLRLVKGQYPAALGDLDAALDSALAEPAKASIYNNRGLTQEKLGARDKAIADFRKALAANPSEEVKSQALAGLARLGSDRGGATPAAVEAPAQADPPAAAAPPASVPAVPAPPAVAPSAAPSVAVPTPALAPAAGAPIAAPPAAVVPSR